MKRSLRSWLWRVPIDREVDDEIAFHIEMRTRELVERGVDPKTAREIVRARLGDVSRLKRTCEDLGRKREREMRVTRWIEELWGDVAYALRQLKASPGFTAVAVVTLALGIGANSAMFALADATLLKPLPFPEPDRLVMLSELRASGARSRVNPLDFEDWGARVRAFTGIAAWGGRRARGQPAAFGGVGGPRSRFHGNSRRDRQPELDLRRRRRRRRDPGPGRERAILRCARRETDRRPHVRRGGGGPHE